ncbi:MAG TPA: hypothetical protein VHW24_10900 [Bryobacteraceae bacterium]|nr:hypothetical protein [Bryobacteraceae bacterium]
MTVVSGSSGFGKHASLFLEYYDNLNDEFPKTEMYDVHHAPNSTKIKIQKFDCHFMQGGNIILTTQIPKVNGQNQPIQNTNGASDAHHHSYIVNHDRMTRVKAAIQEFKRKAEETGRYTYVAPGGALGFMFSKVGQRGVNCADFVIKVLEKANVAKLGSGLFNSPYRIAS